MGGARQTGADPITAVRPPLMLAGMAALVAAAPAAETGGPGASVPFTTYEAELGQTNGVVLPFERTEGTFAAEASGRRAVRIAGPGQYVELVLDKPADGLTLRYAIPDSADGRGLEMSARLHVGERRVATIPLTSRYAWYYGRYPFTNRPQDGRAHHFYDHVRVRLPAPLPAGTRLRLSLDSPRQGQWAIVDLLDAERVPPPSPPPPGALSVLEFGADPSGARSSAGAFDKAIATGQRRDAPIWIPPGTYRIDRHLAIDRVRLVGAGHWHSILRGHGIGLYGRKPPRFSSNIELRDFAIVGEVAERNDKQPLAGIGGALSRSTISGLWIQHTKVGLWLDGPLDRLVVADLRILDQAADGLNFHGGVTRSVVRNSFVRNTGDDGLAMWSHRTENVGNRFERNTVIAPLLGNGIAIYGGRDLAVTGNLVADTLTQGGGIHLGARFSATPFAGDIRIERNRVVRGGVLDPNWKFGVGALWFYALDRPIDGARIRVRDLELVDSLYSAIHFIGEPIRGVEFDSVTIRGAGTGVLQVQAAGEASFRNVVATSIGGPGVASDRSNFKIVDRGGNRGWDSRGALQPPNHP